MLAAEYLDRYSRQLRNHQQTFKVLQVLPPNGTNRDHTIRKITVNLEDRILALNLFNRNKESIHPLHKAHAVLKKTKAKPAPLMKTAPIVTTHISKSMVRRLSSLLNSGISIK